MMLTMLVSAAARGMNVAVSVATVPLALSYLGVEQYGIWLVLLSIVSWLSFAQLGVAPSLLNHLAAEDRADTRQATGLVATAWWLQTATAGLLSLILLGLVPVLPLRPLLNVGQDIALAPIRGAATLLWLGFLLGLPIQIAMTVFQARQEGYLAHMWDAIRSLARLGGILVVIQTGLGMPGFAAAYALAPLIPGAASAVHVFGRRYRILAPDLRHFSRVWTGPLLRTGLQFAGLAVGAMVISSTDNIVIAQILGPAAVPSYAVTFLLVQLFVMVEMVALDAVWPAYTEAAARGDGEWVRRTHVRLLRGSVAGAVVFAIALLALGRVVISVWAGAAVVPSMPLLMVMALLVVVQSVQLCYGRLTTALGAVRTNMLVGLANAAINLPASIVLARWIGLPGVALGTVVGYVVAGVPLVVYASRAMAVLSRRSASGASSSPVRQPAAAR